METIHLEECYYTALTQKEQIWDCKTQKNYTTI